MLFLYKILTSILYPFLIVFIFFRKLKKREHSKRYKEKSLEFNIKEKKYKTSLVSRCKYWRVGSVMPIIKELNSNNKLEFLLLLQL